MKFGDLINAKKNKGVAISYCQNQCVANVWTFQSFYLTCFVLNKKYKAE